MYQNLPSLGVVYYSAYGAMERNFNQQYIYGKWLKFYDNKIFMLPFTVWKTLSIKHMIIFLSLHHSLQKNCL